MASFIYFYSKFTEEFLLLSAAGMFFLMAIYCYHWVVKKRRLGAARDQIPAGMVKIYLNQLIGEAQFVRTQLFGLLGGEAGTTENGARFQMPHADTGAASAAGGSAPIPGDLLDRLKALEGQLSDKESMVININVEKTKLLEEIENLRQNKLATQGASGGNNNDLLAKIKALEERLEEYALFEDDLANLKRLQQENASLKKRLEQMGTNAPAPVAESPALALAPEPAQAPAVEAPAEDTSGLDPAAVNALLNGVSPIAPEAPVEAAVEAPADEDFEKLIDSVETSLKPEAPATPEPAAEPITATASVTSAAPAPAATEAKKDDSGNKTDEELLKEFESLLNS